MPLLTVDQVRLLRHDNVVGADAAGLKELGDIALVDVADKFHDVSTFDRVVTLARTRAQVQLHHLGITVDDAHLFQRLANRIELAV